MGLYRRFRTIFLLFGTFFLSQEVFSQGNTEVFLVNCTETLDGFTFENLRNLSQNAGYDNQPYFLDNNTLLYARNHDGQTDVSVYDMSTGTEAFWNAPTEGGEYSPQPIPNNGDIAAVRLDPDGLQRLYRFSKNSKGEELIPNAVVAYFAFYDANTVVSSVIVNETLQLVVYDLKEKQSYKLLEGSGRAFQKIPKSTSSVSYTALNEEKNYDVYQLDMEDLESFFVVQLPIGVQDLVWYNDSKILIGSGTQLFVYDLFGDGNWQRVANFSKEGIKDITRLAVSPDGKTIAFVAEKNNP
ncbi:MAG: hypothetical protein R2793_00040 [Flavobacteriaceae bacterium]